MQKSSKLAFSARLGKQKPERFESQPKSVLEASFDSTTIEQVGLSVTLTQTSQERVEVNSVF